MHTHLHTPMRTPQDWLVSLNLASSCLQVLTPDGKLKPRDELKSVFASAGVSLDRPIVASCGTGVTACVLALVRTASQPDKVPIL